MLSLKLRVSDILFPASHHEEKNKRGMLNYFTAIHLAKLLAGRLHP